MIKQRMQLERLNAGRREGVRPLTPGWDNPHPHPSPQSEPSSLSLQRKMRKGLEMCKRLLWSEGLHRRWLKPQEY